jgi:hypothetical protein
MGGQFGFSNQAGHMVGDKNYSPLDAKIIDIHQDNRPLGDAGEVTPLSKVMPDNAYVAYSKTPFFDKLNKMQGTDPTKVSGQQYADARHKLFTQYPVKTIPLKGLILTQTVVNTGKINKMRDKIKGGDTKGGLAVVQYKGHNYLMDGHHRTAAEYLEGATSLKANVINLDARKDDIQYGDVPRRNPQAFPQKKFKRVVAI